MLVLYNQISVVDELSCKQGLLCAVLSLVMHKRLQEQLLAVTLRGKEARVSVVLLPNRRRTGLLLLLFPLCRNYYLFYFVFCFFKSHLAKIVVLYLSVKKF